MLGTVYEHPLGQSAEPTVSTVSYPDGWQQRGQQNERPLNPFGNLRQQQDGPRVQEPDFDPSPDPPTDDSVVRQPENPPVDQENDVPIEDPENWRLRDDPARLSREAKPQPPNAREPQRNQFVPKESAPKLQSPAIDDEEDGNLWDPPAELMPPKNGIGYPQRSIDEGCSANSIMSGQVNSHPGLQAQSQPAEISPLAGMPQHYFEGQSPSQPVTNRYGYPRQYPSGEFQIPDPYGNSPRDNYRQHFSPDRRAGDAPPIAQHPQAQWGVAGYEHLISGDRSCGGSVCGFDCGTPTFYLKGYGASVDLRNLVSGNNTLLTDNGGGFGFALGQRQGRNLRTELEYGWRSNSVVGLDDGSTFEFVTGKIKSQAGMANAYWEFINFPSSHWTPYVGAGLGFARMDIELRDGQGQPLTLERAKDSGFAYQFMGGVNYQHNRYLDFFVEYRLFNADSFGIETNTGQANGHYDYRANNLIGGIRWKF
jgi:opacity protein-like surface antigen